MFPVDQPLQRVLRLVPPWRTRQGDQPWMLPLALVLMLAVVAALLAYVTLLNSQVQRGEKFREALRNGMADAARDGAGIQPALNPPALTTPGHVAPAGAIHHVGTQGGEWLDHGDARVGRPARESAAKPDAVAEPTAR